MVSAMIGSGSDNGFCGGCCFVAGGLFVSVGLVWFCFARSRAAVNPDMHECMTKKPTTRMMRQPMLPRDIFPLFACMAHSIAHRRRWKKNDDIFFYFVLAVQCTYLVHYPRNAPKGHNKTTRKNDMSNQHDLHKHQIAVKFPHRIWRQIELAARARQMKPGEYIRFVVSEAVDSIELTAEDAQIIANRIRDAQAKGHMV